MLKVGLTGGIGSGKTAVSNLFSALGIRVIDTDIIAHDILCNDQQAIQEIVDCFSESVLDDNNAIDRKKLANIVFDNSDNKEQLEKILHPRIRQIAIQQMDSNLPQDDNRSERYIVIVVPLLLETDFHELVDQILVVTADEETRIKRIQQRDNRTVEEICSIMRHQLDENEQISAADDVIENSGNINNLAPQIDALDKKYTALASAI